MFTWESLIEICDIISLCKLKTKTSFPDPTQGDQHDEMRWWRFGLSQKGVENERTIPWLEIVHVSYLSLTPDVHSCATYFSHSSPAHALKAANRPINLVCRKLSIRGFDCEKEG
jgi:hypothetical protein